ncbi:MAG: alkaline phosphatase, partial [Aminobacteriaceae bacterium]
MTYLKLVPRFQRFLKNAVFSFLAVLLLTSAAPGAEGRESAKYIFLFIGDGMGEAQVRAAELYSLGSGTGKISFSSMPVRGKMSTSTADGAVTDSAAAGTALASGFKTKNGILNMDPSGTKRFLTVAMLARDRGMKVGIVTSSFLNDATPAAFYAWRPSRTDWYEIGEQLAESGFDYFAGGGVTRRRGRKGNL